jgi:two-component system phosphate regulon sensor histidine kinase PhoR
VNADGVTVDGSRSPEKVELNRQHLEWVVQRHPHATVILDEALLVRHANLAAQRLAHRLHERVRVGDPLFDAGHDPSLRELAARLFRHRVLVERRLHMSEGATLVVQGFRHKHDSLAVLLIEDTTKRDRRLQAEEDFLVNASHEFLSPLTSIAAAAHVLEEGGHDEEVRERFVGNIVEATARLVNTSRALLVLARAEAGVEPPRLELLRLKPLLTSAFAPERMPGCDVTINCPGDAVALADHDLLQLALGALRDNAFAHAGGMPVTVGVAEIEEGASLEIEIRSDGTRLPAKVDLARVTKRFVSGEGRDSTGFGVGLSIAERSARLVGGGLSLQADGRYLRARVEVPAGRAGTQ